MKHQWFPIRWSHAKSSNLVPFVLFMGAYGIFLRRYFHHVICRLWSLRGPRCLPHRGWTPRPHRRVPPTSVLKSLSCRFPLFSQTCTLCPKQNKLDVLVLFFSQTLLACSLPTFPLPGVPASSSFKARVYVTCQRSFSDPPAGLVAPLPIFCNKASPWI